MMSLTSYFILHKNYDFLCFKSLKCNKKVIIIELCKIIYCFKIDQANQRNISRLKKLFSINRVKLVWPNPQKYHLKCLPKINKLMLSKAKSYSSSQNSKDKKVKVKKCQYFRMRFEKWSKNWLKKWIKKI